MKISKKLLSVIISLAVFVCAGIGFSLTSFAADEYDNSYSLTVGDNIITNYYIDADGYKADGGVTLEYTYNNSEKEEYTLTTETVDLSSVSDSTYRIEIPQAAAQISEPVTITVKRSDGSVLDTFERSALGYCNDYINMSDAEIGTIVKGKRLQAVCKAIVAYAYSAQQQFSSYLELEGTVPINTSYYSDLDLPSADYTDTTGRVNTKGERVSFKSISYFCTSSARLRFYLNTATATAEEIASTPTSANIPSGAKVSKGYDDEKELYFIDINGLKPVDFDELMTVNFCDASITMSVLQYAGMNIASSKVTATVKNLSKALIVYYNRTIDYFSNSTTVTFDGNGGTASTPQITVNTGDSLTLPNATRTGFTFSGWYTAATGGTRVGGNGDSYTPSDNIELFAQWSAYTVTYNANGGSVSPASDTVDSSGNVTLPTPTWAGHQFDGWYTAATGGTLVGNAGATYAPSSSTTIFAHWTAYTVTFNANGNDATVSPSSATANNNGTVTLATPTRTGYTFNGWYTAATGGTFVGNAGASYTPTSSTTIFAHWTVNTHTVSWTTSNSTTNVSLRDGNTSISNGADVEYDTVVRIDLTFNQSKNRSFSVKQGNTNITLYSNYACTTTKSIDTSSDSSTYYFKMPDANVSITSSCESGGGCVAEDTLITLADGTHKPIEDIRLGDMVMTWSHWNGCYEAQPVIVAKCHGKYKTEVFTLVFSDGTEVRCIGEHAFLDATTNAYVYFNNGNISEYIGDSFVKQNIDGNNEEVTLVNYTITTENVGVYSIVTAYNANFMAENMISLTSGEGFSKNGLFRIFDLGEDLKYDEEKMRAEIEQYGLYTYDDFKDYLTLEQYYMLNAPYYKVLVEKGLVTFDDLIYMIQSYVTSQ